MVLQDLLAGGVEYVQDTQPSDADAGEIWLDTSVVPPVEKVYADVGGGSWLQTESDTIISNNLDAPVSQAGASAEVKSLELKFLREMSRLFFDRSLAELNFSDGTFEIFTDTADISITGGQIFAGSNGRVEFSPLINITIDSKNTVATVTASNTADAFAFNNDGSQIGVLFGNGDMEIYSLSTAYDVSTASQVGTLGLESGFPRHVALDDTGTTAVHVGGSGSNEAYEYSLSTANDFTTLSSTGTTYALAGSRQSGVHFNSDGTLMIECARKSDEIFEHKLTTPYDISTASYTNTSFDPNASTPAGVDFDDTGKLMIVTNDANSSASSFEIYRLTTAFDISTATFDREIDALRDRPRTGTLTGSQNRITTGDLQSNNINQYPSDVFKTTSGSITKTKTLGFTPKTVVVEDTVDNSISVSYDVTDGSNNTVTVQPQDVGTEVDASSLTDGNITITANVSITSEGSITDFAAYFE